MQVANPYCRVVDEADGSELCRYSLREAGSQNGLLIGKISREVGGRWGFHALGIPCRGRTYKESLPQLIAASQAKTASLPLRSSFTGGTDGGPSKTPVSQGSWVSPAPP